MNLENAGLQDRVIDLEKRSAEQANELACLRSSLADCLRRLNLLESARGMKVHSSQRPVLHNNGRYSCPYFCIPIFFLVTY